MSRALGCLFLFSFSVSVDYLLVFFRSLVFMGCFLFLVSLLLFIISCLMSFVSVYILFGFEPVSLSSNLAVYLSVGVSLGRSLSLSALRNFS